MPGIEHRTSKTSFIQLNHSTTTISSNNLAQETFLIIKRFVTVKNRKRKINMRIMGFDTMTSSKHKPFTQTTLPHLELLITTTKYKVKCKQAQGNQRT